MSEVGDGVVGDFPVSGEVGFIEHEHEGHVANRLPDLTLQVERGLQGGRSSAVGHQEVARRAPQIGQTELQKLVLPGEVPNEKAPLLPLDLQRFFSMRTPVVVWYVSEKILSTNRAIRLVFPTAKAPNKQFFSAPWILDPTSSEVLPG